jgi:hypothetical protein
MDIYTIRNLSDFSEVMFDIETLGLGTRCVGVLSICNDNILIRNARIAEVLRLCGSLVTEPNCN